MRKLAKDLGVDLGSVTPTGDGGIVTRADVEAAAAESHGASYRLADGDRDDVTTRPAPTGWAFARSAPPSRACAR